MYLDEFDERPEKRDLRWNTRWLLERLLWILILPVFIVTLDGQFAIETSLGHPTRSVAKEGIKGLSLTQPR